MWQSKALKALSPALWVAIHGALGGVFLLSLIVAGPIRVNTNLFDILPASASLKGAATADKMLSDRTGRQVSLLAASADFDEAKRGADIFYQTFAENRAVFESLSLYVDEAVLAQFTAYLHEYRYMLLSEEDQRLLESGASERLAEDALAQVFGAFTLSSLDNVESDPFLLANRRMNRVLASSLLSSGSLAPRDGVLAAQRDGLWYVMIRGVLSAQGVSLTNKAGAVPRIYAACAELAQPSLHFVYSGIPFHSWESSSNAQREISLISTVTLVIILLLFLLVFRSLLPALLSVVAALISLAAASGVTLLVFREIHVLTFVFGTTLIGTCVDYSIHYFMHWKTNVALKTGDAIRAHIFRGVMMSFVSTEICFVALLFAPFVILKQFAVFSVAGLASSFLTVTCLYPAFPLKRDNAPAQIRPSRRTVGQNRRSRLGLITLAALCAVCVAVLAALHDKVRAQNDLSTLYRPSGALLESEKTAATVLNQGSSGWYFIVAGADAEETLEREEALRKRLDAEIIAENLRSYLAASLFVPSTQTQRASYNAARALVPLADAQFAALGFPPAAVEAFSDDFVSQENRFITPNTLALPAYLRDVIATLWIETADACYSCVLPLHTKDEAAFRAIAAELDGVFFINKVKDIGSELDTLTRIMLTLFGAAYLVIAIVVKCCYKWKETLRICAVPFFMILATLAVFALADIPLGFFSVTGLVLVFGLGLDYMFYLTESADATVSIRAIQLSFATTALSFGALALSGFVPVHIFGLSVLTGLTAAFAAGMLLNNQQS
ncbi:MAG: MMPL family transporter [Treponema sp.]|nr:MMPL family transporter [Treponema sp.]